MRLTTTQPAGADERFTPGAFDSQIGQTIPFRVGNAVHPATLVAAEVAPDGTGVELTL